MKYNKDIEQIVNNLAIGQGIDFDICECAYLITQFNNDHGTISTPFVNNYRIDNGCLVINDITIERVAPLPPKVDFSEEAYYLEGRILARQGC